MFDKEQPAYESLRSIIAERTQGIIFWVGSGPSTEAGLPTWRELFDFVVRDLRSAVAPLSDGDEKKRRFLNRIRSSLLQADLWRGFQILDDLAPTEFAASIRLRLTPTSRVVPEVYSKIWRLKAHGIITTNLDRLAAAAHSILSPDQQLVAFRGDEAGKYTHILQSANPFCLDMHGVIDDRSTWILTRNRLNSLLKNRGYRHFLATCLSARIVVLLGVRADDQAVAEHLLALKRQDIQFEAPFWITDKNDFETFRWAQEMNVRPIFYSSRGGSHAALVEILDDLHDYPPKEAPALPVAPPIADKGPLELPNPEVLSQRSAEEIRKILNDHAAFILAQGRKEDYAAYYNFVAEYNEAIHRA